MSAGEAGRGHRVEPARDVEPDRGAGAPAARECPSCHATSVGEVSFCGSCGFDFVTGSEPLEADAGPRRDADDVALPTAEELGLGEADLERRPTVPPPTPPAPGHGRRAHEQPRHRPPSREPGADWVAEIWVDHVWAGTRDSDQPVPDAGPPEVVRLTTDNLVVGRTNIERGLHPDLDAGTDAGVSVRHAQLTSDGHRWWVEDLDTANGTYVGTVGGALPTEPLDKGERVEIDEDDRVYLGGWTRLVLRRER